MTQDSKHTPLFSAARFLARAAQIVAVCLVLTDLTLMTGVLERRVIPGISQRLLGARIHLWIDGWQPLYIRGLRVQHKDTAPLLGVDALAVHFQHYPSRIESVNIWGVRAHIDGKDRENTNYAFLLSYLNRNKDKESGGDIASWLPRHVTASGITLQADMPEWAVRISGLDAMADIQAANRITATLSGDGVRAGWQSEQDWPDIPLPEGQVAATLTLSPENIRAQAKIQLPDFLVVEGVATAEMTDEMRIELAVDEIQLDGPVFGGVASLYAPAPLSFDLVSIAPLQLTATIVDMKPYITDAHLDAQIEGLLLGNRDAPWYAGNLSVEVTGEHGATSQATWSATLNQGQRVSGTLATEEEGTKFTAQFQNWSSEELWALWPEPYAQWKEYLPELRQTEAVLECRIASNHIMFSGSMSPVSSAGTAVDIEFTGDYNLQQGNASVATQIALGKGNCAIETTLQEGALSAIITAESVPASEALELLPWPALTALRAAVSGKSVMQQDADGRYVFDVEADAANPGYGDWRVPESQGALGVKGRFAVAADFSQVAADGILRFPDDSVTVDIANLIYDIGQSRVAARFAGTAELASLGAAFGYDDLWGDASFEGAFGLQDWLHGEVAPMRVSLEPLGYGDLSLPYGRTLTADLPLRFNIETVSLETETVQIALDEGTRLVTDALQITPQGVNAASTIVFGTDFAPLVAKGYLAAADGQLSLAIEGFRLDDTGLAGEITYSCNASRISLPDNLADMRGLNAEGKVSLHPVPTGEGVLEIEELKAAGTTLRKSTGGIRVENDTLIFDNVTFDLFGGGVVARAELRPLEAGLPIIVSGDVSNIDLSIFTNEFQPPSLVLTGRVNGTFAAGLTAQQLTMLEVDFDAYKDFTVNRDMVEQLLLGQYVGDMTGGRQMTRMLASVIGKDEQRQFDRALLKLGLEDERIAGYAKLESDNLNLTVDIKADPLALLEAIRARQQQ